MLAILTYYSPYCPPSLSVIHALCHAWATPTARVGLEADALALPPRTNM
jgi:hypothetical protein